MKRLRKVDAPNWVLVDMKDGAWFCERCDARTNPVLPAPLEAYLLELQAFGLRHKDCKPKEPPADVKP